MLSEKADEKEKDKLEPKAESMQQESIQKIESQPIAITTKLENPL